MASKEQENSAQKLRHKKVLGVFNYREEVELFVIDMSKSPFYKIHASPCILCRYSEPWQMGNKGTPGRLTAFHSREP